MLHKAHVELNEIKVNLLQHVQGRIAAAEVVHPDLEAQLLKTPDLFFDKLEILAEGALGDLDRQHRARDPRLVDPTANLLHDIAAVKVRAREVDGLRHEEDPRRFLLLQFLQHALDHVEVQLVDQPGFLQRGDKIGR